MIINYVSLKRILKTILGLLAILFNLTITLEKNIDIVVMEDVSEHLIGNHKFKSSNPCISSFFFFVKYRKKKLINIIK